MTSVSSRKQVSELWKLSRLPFGAIPADIVPCCIEELPPNGKVSNVDLQ